MNEFTPFEFIKIYIGQLPLETQESQLKLILQPLASLRQVKIIKGDHNRGKFDLFCYAFVTMQGNQAFAHDIINKLQRDHPNWKMNVKHDNDRRRQPKNFNNPNMGYPPPPVPYHHGYPPMQPFPGYYPPPQPIQQVAPPSSNDKIVGQKPCNIMVRQLWIGGIPEQLDKSYMTQLMNYYGIIEEIEIFPKFAFIKYKQATQATTAFQRAQEISQRLGNPPGFRIFFSDPARRAYIVSNHYEFQRQSTQVPILFIGFPPVTSAKVQMEEIKPVVQKISPISGEYMRKNLNAQSRSYFLFSFDHVKNAQKVKQELNRRKDLLGDKRAQVTVLLEEQSVLKNKDLSHTEKMFQRDGNQQKQKRGYFDPNMKPPMMPIGYPMYPNMPPNPYMPPPSQSFYPNNYYMYQQPYYKPEEGNQAPQNHNNQSSPPRDNNIHDLLKDVMKGSENQKKPEKSQEGREEDILSKLLGNEANIPQQKEEKLSEDEKQRKKEDRQPSWSGFLTWKNQQKVQIDGFSKKVEPQDCYINIKSMIQFKDLILKQKNVMVLEASTNIGKKTFKDYIKNLKDRAGVTMNKEYLMYIMAKCSQSDQIQEIAQDQLLVVLQKASTLTLIKDKLIKCEDLS